MRAGAIAQEPYYQQQPLLNDLITAAGAPLNPANRCQLW